MELDKISRLNFTNIDLLNERIDIRRARLPSVTPTTNYDPLENRTPTVPIEPWMAYMNVIRSFLAPGMLFMPLAISQTGYVLGPILLFSFGAILIHTHLLLLHNLTEICRQMRIPHISYRFGFRLAVLHGPPLFHFLGNNAPAIISILMLLSQMGICIVYILLSANSLRDILDLDSARPAVIFLVIPFLLLISFMTNLQVVVYFSMIGSALNLLGFIMLIGFSMTHVQGEMLPFPRNVRTMFRAIGIYMFNLTAVAVILSLDKGLTKPQIMREKFGVVTVGMAVPLVFSAIFGVIMYWAYGSMDADVLRSLPLDHPFSSVILSNYVVSVAFAYPMQCYPAVSILADVIKYHDPYAMPSERIIKMIRTFGRPVFVLLTFIISYVAPFTRAFVPLVGNFCTSILAIIFPALMDICMRYPNNYGARGVYLIKDIALIFLGSLVFCFGIYYSWQYLYVLVQSYYLADHHSFY